MAAIELIIVPDQDEPEAAEVLVDGRVGDRPYRFLLDTGAATSRLAHDDYTATLPSVARGTSAGVFAPATRDSIVVPSLDIGPIHVDDVSVERSPKGVAEGRNLIGMDVLTSYCLGFRFEHAEVEIHERFPGSMPYQELVAGRRGHPYVPVTCGPKIAMAVWDTGASMTVVDEAFVRRTPAFFREVGVSIGTDATGTAVETNTFVMAETVIGGHRFQPHRVAAVDLSPLNSTVELPMDMILGYSTLRLAAWVFDFPAKKWAVTQLVQRAALPST